MFSPKVCPLAFYAILAAIFICQTFFQPADGNDEFARIVKAFTGKVEKLKESHSQQEQGIHAREKVVTNMHEALRNILFSDIAKLHQFILEYKHFLQSSAKNYATTATYIEKCGACITILEVGFGRCRYFFTENCFFLSRIKESLHNWTKKKVMGSETCNAKA
jgi:hypothetical protein